MANPFGLDSSDKAFKVVVVTLLSLTTCFCGAGVWYVYNPPKSPVEQAAEQELKSIHAERLAERAERAAEKQALLLSKERYDALSADAIKKEGQRADRDKQVLKFVKETLEYVKPPEKRNGTKHN